MLRKQLAKRITIDPEFLNSDIKKHVFEKASEISMLDCSKEHGYIIGVNRLLKIEDSYISNSSCEIVFDVIIDVNTIKPEVGKTFTGITWKVFPDGIFVDIKNIFKVLIPLISLFDYRFEKGVFINLKDDAKRIKEGDEVELRIIGTKYSNKNYASFGELISDLKEKV